jgi:hypothetical protein
VPFTWNILVTNFLNLHHFYRSFVRQIYSSWLLVESLKRCEIFRVREGTKVSVQSTHSYFYTYHKLGAIQIIRDTSGGGGVSQSVIKYHNGGGGGQKCHVTNFKWYFQ